MSFHFPSDFSIPNEQQEVSAAEIEAEIDKLIKKLQENTKMSMLRSTVGSAEIVLIHEVETESRQEFIRIAVSERRKEVRLKLCDFNLFCGTDIPKKDQNSDCDCNK